MKYAMIGSLASLAIGLSVITYAATNNYFPPERLHCTLDKANRLSCNDFNRQLLAEDTFSADLEQGKDQVFYFSSGSAYFSSRQNQSSVFFAYKNPKLQMVKLKSISTDIKPDFSKNSWHKVRDDLYICDGAYSQCVITR